MELDEMEQPTHAYCAPCGGIEPLLSCHMDYPTPDGQFRGGDLICETCGHVIATIYVQGDDPCPER